MISMEHKPSSQLFMSPSINVECHSLHCLAINIEQLNWNGSTQFILGTLENDAVDISVYISGGVHLRLCV